MSCYPLQYILICKQKQKIQKDIIKALGEAGDDVPSIEPLM